MLQENITVRKAGLNDLEILRRFEQGIIAAERPFNKTLKDDPVNYYDLEGMLIDPQVDLVVAESGREIIACGYSRIEASSPFLKHTKHAYLGMMFVHPSYRGRGVNRIILEELKCLVKSRGICELRLEVFSQNQSAIRAYEKAGFESHLIQMRMAL